jgi:ribosomal protein L30/L7E
MCRSVEKIKLGLKRVFHVVRARTSIAVLGMLEALMYSHI